MSYRLDPDQDQHSVGPDLSANCLQWLSAENKLPLARKELKTLPYYYLALYENLIYPVCAIASIRMDSCFWFDTINWGWSIIHII